MVAAEGTQVLLALNLKSILGVVEKYLTPDNEKNNELVQYVLTYISRRIKQVRSGLLVAKKLNRFAHTAARRFIFEETCMLVSWFKKDLATLIIADVDALFLKHPYGLSKDDIRRYSSELARTHGIDGRRISDYLVRRNDQALYLQPDQLGEDTTYEQAVKRSLIHDLNEELKGCNDRERIVLIARFVHNKTQAEVGKELGVTVQRISRIEYKALEKSFRSPFRLGIREYWE